MTTDWQFYPQTRHVPKHLQDVVAVFDAATSDIGSKAWKLNSNQVLAKVAEPLSLLGFAVEMGTTRDKKVWVPVLFGRRGRTAKAFEVDAFSSATGTVIEVEAGRAFTNNQFLKDLFEACVMPGVLYLVIAVRSDYRRSKDFEKVCAFIDSLYASDRLRLPLEGLLIVGY
jgi:hypothetical protein